MVKVGGEGVENLIEEICKDLNQSLVEIGYLWG